MEENVKVEEQVVDTPATPVETTSDTEQKVEDAIKTFTQEQVNEFMRERVNRSHANTLKHYGVDSYDELDEIVNNSRNWKEQFDKLTLANQSLLRDNVFLKNNINADRYDDIDVYFKGAGLDFNEETFGEVLSKHPEWIKPQPKTITITTLGKEAEDRHVETEEEKRKRIFG